MPGGNWRHPLLSTHRLTPVNVHLGTGVRTAESFFMKLCCGDADDSGRPSLLADFFFPNVSLVGAEI